MSDTADTQRQLADEIKKEHDLIHQVFRTPAGRKLLAKLADQYVWDKQLHPDPHVLYARIGVQDLITHFMKVCGDKP